MDSYNGVLFYINIKNSIYYSLRKCYSYKLFYGKTLLADVDTEVADKSVVQLVRGFTD